MAKVDKRSNRSKLKDDMVEDINKRIKHFETMNTVRKKDIERDEFLIRVLGDQVLTIQKLCNDG